MRRALIVAFVLALLATSPLIAKSDGPPDGVTDEEYEARKGIKDRFSISLGGFLAGFDTKAAVATGPGLGAVIRLEEQLGLQSSQTDVRMEGHWRFTRRQHITFGYFGLNRQSTRVIDEEFEWNGELVQVDAIVDSHFDTQLFNVAYQFAFVNTGKIEVGVRAGASVYAFDIGLDVVGSVQGPNDPQVGDASGSVSLVAPVPVVGQYIDFTIMPRFFYRSSFQVFTINYQNVEGRLLDIRLSLDYYVSRHFGFGLGYNAVDIEYRDLGASEKLDVEYRYNGLLAYVTYGF